jgi:hypothetical protein
MWTGRPTKCFNSRQKEYIHKSSRASLTVLGTNWHRLQRVWRLPPCCRRGAKWLRTSAKWRGEVSEELYLQSPPASDFKDYNVATGSLTSFIIVDKHIFVNCIWVDIRWQYGTHLHKNIV